MIGLAEPSEASGVSAVATSTGLSKLLDAAAVPGSSAVAAMGMAVAIRALGTGDNGLSWHIISQMLVEGGEYKAGSVQQLPAGLTAVPSTTGVLKPSCSSAPSGLVGMVSAEPGVTIWPCIT